MDRFQVVAEDGWLCFYELVLCVYNKVFYYDITNCKLLESIRRRRDETW